MHYLGQIDYQHDSQESIGILITNLGTPDAPTPQALKKYLAEFLWDNRVVEVPRILWWLILNGIILNTRPKKVAKIYASIWQEQGSPLLTIAKAQLEALNKVLPSSIQQPFHLALGMRYGNPSIADALEELRQKQATKILVFPLYPQYSAATVGSSFDAVAKVLQSWRWVPELRFINHYYDEALYIEALAKQIKQQLSSQPQKIIFSFHGVPKRYLLSGDPYYCQCHKTARLVAKKLELSEEQWIISFQSRFGKEEWLKPYTDEVLMNLPKQGIKDIAIICPGFSADCLETLEEIQVENKHYFLQAGGEKYIYIPALNTQESHMVLLKNVILNHLQGWLDKVPLSKEEAYNIQQRALKLGARQ